MFDKLETCALEFVSDKSNLDVEGIILRTVKILQVKDSQKSGLRNPHGDKNVLVIMSNMLSESQVHKEVDGHVHEVVEVDNGIADDSDLSLEDVKTQGQSVICKNKEFF